MKDLIRATTFNILILLLPLACAFSICNQKQQISSLSFRESASFLTRSVPNTPRAPLCLLFESKDGSFVEAEDLPAIQKLFTKYCDKDGLMTKAELVEMPPFSEMLVSFIIICVRLKKSKVLERKRPMMNQKQL
jgi:hypothetical protein